MLASKEWQRKVGLQFAFSLILKICYASDAIRMSVIEPVKNVSDATCDGVWV
jgi:hypothetical protein